MQKPLNQAFPDRVALVEGEANLTYEDLEQRIGSMASGLLAGLGLHQCKVVDCLL